VDAETKDLPPKGIGHKDGNTPGTEGSVGSMGAVVAEISQRHIGIHHGGDLMIPEQLVRYYGGSTDGSSRKLHEKKPQQKKGCGKKGQQEIKTVTL